MRLLKLTHGAYRARKCLQNRIAQLHRKPARICQKHVFNDKSNAPVGTSTIFESPPGFSVAEIANAMNHLMSMPQVVVEDRGAVEQALASVAGGLGLADALHLASYRECVSLASFDGRKFARRAKRMGLMPKVVIPA